jgi:hypothetical protein
MEHLPMQRLPDWAARLGHVVAQRLAMPFAWGPNDCAAWVADAVAAMHGRDTLRELRGTRRSPAQAWRQLQRGGGYPAAMARAGLQPVPPALAGRGDVVLLAEAVAACAAMPAPAGRGWPGVLGVCLGEDGAAPGPAGLVLVPMQQALQAWRV